VEQSNTEKFLTPDLLKQCEQHLNDKPELLFANPRTWQSASKSKPSRLLI